tara:strand:+ start:171 stop:707 length:537 start_codon:yes stop_codon:yes gene_type:complete
MSVKAVPVWERDVQGQQVVVGVISDGIDYLHPDLDDQVRIDLSYDFVNGKFYPLPTGADVVGTAMAGLVAAKGNNYICGAGVAPRALLAGLRILESSDDYTEGLALSHMRDYIDIYVNGWERGIYTGVRGSTRMGPSASTALYEGVRRGRGGLGNIFVWSTGISKTQNTNCNYNGFAR